MNVFLRRIVALSLFSLTMQVGAVTLSLEPTSSTAAAGDSVSLDLVIAGLGDYTSDSLGDFDLDIAFDSTALSFEGYSLSANLGELSLFEALDYSFGEYAVGTIGLTEVSLLMPWELDSIQPSEFTLATLDFSVDLIGAGATVVSIDTVYALGDGYGNRLHLDGTSSAVITTTDVSEPTSLALISLGLVGLGFSRRRLQQKKSIL